MIKKFIFILSICSLLASAQTKGKTTKKAEPAPIPSEPEKRSVDSIMGFAMLDGMTPFESVDYQLPPESETDPVTGKKTFFKNVKRKNDSIRVAFRNEYRRRNMTFYARSKKPVKWIENDKMKLCINIVSKDTFLTHCVVDSTTRDPEFAKVLFNEQKGDSVFQLIYVYAFSKQGGNCNGEKEAKIMFVRWNTKENRASWKSKLINSCAKTVTNMTKTPIEDWDGKSKLVIEYHRGSNFYEIAFDPQHPELGLQNNKEGGKSSGD
jgi:hypothetical protein